MTGPQRVRAELAAALVCGLAATAIAADGVRAWLRERRIAAAAAEAFAAFDRPEVALKASLRALGEDPERAELRALVAALQLDAGEVDDAERLYRDLAREADRDEIAALGQLGLAVASLERARGADGAGATGGQRLDPAIEGHLAKAARAHRLAVQAIEGGLELEAGRAEAAVDRLEQALAASGGAAGSRATAGRGTLIALHGNLALAAARAQRHPRAADERARAAVLAGNQRPRVRAYAEALARWVQADGAPEAREAARAVALDAIRAVGRSGELGLDLEDADAALIHEAIGLAEARADQLEQAVASLSQALRRAPTQERSGEPTGRATSIRWNLGAVHLTRMARATRPQERREQASFGARHLYEAAEALAATAPERAFVAFLAAGLALRVSESPSDAVKALERAERLRPGDVRALVAMGLVYDTWGRKGQPKEAIVWYRKAAAAAPDDALAKAALARAAELEGRR